MNSKVPAPNPAANVEAFLASLEHPFKREILALRQIMLGIVRERHDGKPARAAAAIVVRPRR